MLHPCYTHLHPCWLLSSLGCCHHVLGVSRPPLPLVIMSSFGYPNPLCRRNWQEKLNCKKQYWCFIFLVQIQGSNFSFKEGVCYSCYTPVTSCFTTYILYFAPLSLESEETRHCISIFCESGKILQHVHYWLIYFQKFWRNPDYMLSVQMIWEVSRWSTDLLTKPLSHMPLSHCGSRALWLKGLWLKGLWLKGFVAQRLCGSRACGSRAFWLKRLWLNGRWFRGLWLKFTEWMLSISML